MLLALLLSQAIVFLLSWDEREKALKSAMKSEFFSRTASITRLMESIPVALRQEALLATETNYSRFWLSSEEPTSALAWSDQAARELERPLANLVHLPPQWGLRPPSVEVPSDTAVFRRANASEGWTIPSRPIWDLPHDARFVSFGHANGLGLAVRLNDGVWLNSAHYKLIPSTWREPLITLATAAAILSIIGIVTAERIGRPLRKLTISAEALGRGESVPSLPEEGPDDIRQMAEAFNRMQDRLHRFVEDRIRMLAAIGHDLRTPLTSLRLRAEFVDDPELQKRMTETIDEIQVMTEAMVAFARGEATAEATRNVDLTALVESVCEDLADLGQKVEYREGRSYAYRCRPDALRRAIRNLVENSVRYGGGAKVYVSKQPSSIEIVIEDHGPGIPPALREEVFSPFFRLEKSRSRETGGVGLGMSIARAIVRHHGGDIELADNQPGLRATVRLPPTQQEDPGADKAPAVHWTL
jgi:signal transduction histidine kinase